MSHYAKQKTWEAVRALVGELSLRRRLAAAAMPLEVLRSADGQAIYRYSDLLFILDELTQGGTLDFEKAAGRLSEQNATMLAHKILDLHTEVMGGL